jgi:phosphatidylinositol alpha-1,6-mannosyltransferase
VKHLLVTNDFPPKVGGIQTYLWELWRRLPPSSFRVLTTPHRGASAFDAVQRFRVERTSVPVLLPNPVLVRQIDRRADASGAGIVMLDPALPLGLVGPRLREPYGLVLHGAEVTVPGRLPASRSLLASVLRGARLIVSAGEYPADEARRAARRAALPIVVVPPGVDITRFRPLGHDERDATRRRHGLPLGSVVVLGASRLVPRKGFDVLIEAIARLHHDRPDLVLAIAGAGRDRDRLERIAGRTGVNVRFLGRVTDDELAPLYAAADVFAAPCRNRWAGLEQEGFGIVFVEAAAAGVPAVAGASGGTDDAVIDGETGFVVRRPSDPAAVAASVARLVDDVDLRRRMGEAARARTVAEFAYDVLATRLGAALDGLS